MKNVIETGGNYKWEEGVRGITLFFYAGGMPVGFTLNGESYVYIKNLQGDVLRILDTNGTTVVTYTHTITKEQ